eukprot:TRINITY_DN17153_c0_g1_i1.p1 TRINITY_DN17153_c0_g1~~TRINITY_DN17153_c0_g1_i1.p1  ORF type:complete len:469 (+),score=143.17 TRINITY_DN17153_c0_g1_i1:55-1461(+)
MVTVTWRGLLWCLAVCAAAAAFAVGELLREHAGVVEPVRRRSPAHGLHERVCRRVVDDAAQRHGGRTFEEAVSRNGVLPRFSVSSIRELAPGRCELLLKVDGTDVWVHRGSKAAACPRSAQSATVRDLIKQPVPGSCALGKLTHWHRLRDFLTLLAVLRSKHGPLPPFVVPLDTTDSAWCATKGQPPPADSLSVVASDARAHPSYVPHTLLLPMHLTFYEYVPVDAVAAHVRGRVAVAATALQGSRGAGVASRLRAMRFADRAAGAVWRGQRSGHPELHKVWGAPSGRTMREAVVSASASAPGLINASFGRLPMEDLLRHQAVVAVDGYSFASILKPALLAGALVVRVGGVEGGGSAYEWFEPFLKAGTHYRAARPDAADLVSTVRDALANETEAADVAGRGARLAADLLSPNVTLCYAYLAISRCSEGMTALMESRDVRAQSEWMHLVSLVDWSEAVPRAAADADPE